MAEKSDKPYLDYKKEPNPNINVKFNVKSEVIVHREEKIHIKIQIDHNLPEKTIIRFIIPYSWEPVTLENNFCTIESSTEGYTRKTGSQLMLEYILKESMEEGSYIEFSYNQSEEKPTAGDIAYLDPLYCAVDVLKPNEKIFRRIAIKEIQMKAAEAEFFLVKAPMIYLGEPVDLEIVALDKFGNRDNNFNANVDLKCEACLICPESAEMKNGYAKLRKAIKFQDEELAKETSKRKLLKENLGYDAFPEYEELRKNIGKIYIKYDGIKGISNPIVRDKDIDLNLYWGDVHIHTREFSDGIGTGNDAYNYAKNYSLLDFAALADHVNQRYNDWMEGRRNKTLPFDRHIWQKIVELAQKWSDENFQAIPAYEWSGRIAYVDMLKKSNFGYDAVSDKVVYFPMKNAKNAPIVDYISEDGCLQHQLYKTLRGIDCEIISHTSMSYPMGTYWKEVDNNKEKVVEIYSMHGSSEEYGEGYRPLINARKSGSIRWALEYGLKLGFVAGGDDHYTHPGCPVSQYKMRNLDTILRYRPGITGVFAEELSSKALLSNINKRNCYASTGERIWIKLKINSALMGQEIKIDKVPMITVTVCGTNKVESIELIKNGAIICVRVPKYDRIKFAFKDDNLTIGHIAYYYVRVTQFDGERAWSSPIWVKRIKK